MSWHPVSAFWERRFQELAAFKAREGHCKVPTVYTQNPSLSIWLNNQRAKQKKGRLSQGYVERLNALGVEWRWWTRPGGSGSES